MDFSNGGSAFIQRPTPYPTGLILPEENKPSAIDLWIPFFDGISDFFQTKKKDFIKIMTLMNGENQDSSDMFVKPAFATGKLPQVGISGSKVVSKGAGSIKVCYVCNKFHSLFLTPMRALCEVVSKSGYSLYSIIKCSFRYPRFFERQYHTDTGTDTGGY